MKALPTQFKAGGFWFDQLERIGQIGLFEKTRGRSVSYEVVRIQRQNAWRAFGQDFPASEAMPSSELWGTDGWTYVDCDSAMVRFRDQVWLQNAKALRWRKSNSGRETIAPPFKPCDF